MGFKKNNPGCNCCSDGCLECEGETLIGWDVTIAGVPSQYVIFSTGVYFPFPGGFATLRTTTGWDQINGTWRVGAARSADGDCIITPVSICFDNMVLAQTDWESNTDRYTVCVPVCPRIEGDTMTEQDETISFTLTITDKLLTFIIGGACNATTPTLNGGPYPPSLSYTLAGAFETNCLTVAIEDTIFETRIGCGEPEPIIPCGYGSSGTAITITINPVFV